MDDLPWSGHTVRTSRSFPGRVAAIPRPPVTEGETVDKVSAAYSREQQNKGQTDDGDGILSQLASVCLKGLEQAAKYLMPT